MAEDLAKHDSDVVGSEGIEPEEIDYEDALEDKLGELQSFQTEYQERITSMAASPKMAVKMQKFLEEMGEREEALSSEIGEIIVQWVYEGGKVRLVDELEKTKSTSREKSSGRIRVFKDGEFKDAEIKRSRGRERQVWSPDGDPERRRRRAKSGKQERQKIGAVELHLLDQSFQDKWMKDDSDTGSLVAAFETLSEIMHCLEAPPENIGEIPVASREMRALSEVLDRIEEWAELPSEVLNRFMHMLAARCRHIQDRLQGRMKEIIDPADEISSFFPRMSYFAKIGDSGFVYGLARDHTPDGNSWLSDAHYWWGELQEYLPDDPSGGVFNVEKALNRFDDFVDKNEDPQEVSRYLGTLLEAGLPSDDPRVVKRAMKWVDHLEGPKFKTLRSACREEAADDGLEEKDLTLENWPHLDRTRDGVAVLVGGTPKPEAKRRIAEAFGFHDVEWINSKHTRRISGLRDRIDAGTIDFVIFLCRYQDHAANDILKDTCKERGVPMAHVTQGYGIGRIKMALEDGIEAAG